MKLPCCATIFSSIFKIILFKIHIACIVAGLIITLYLLVSWQVFADNFVRREVASIVVSCIFSSEGCPWKGEVRHFEVLNYLRFSKEFLRGDMYSQFLQLSCAICEFCYFQIIMRLKQLCLECRFHKNCVRR